MKKSALMLALVFMVAFASGFAIGNHRGFESGKPEAAAPSPKDSQEKVEPIGESKRAFKWGQMESTNYAEFVHNLRTIHCPERTITEIIEADLRRAYAPRFAEAARATALLDYRTREAEKARSKGELAKEIDSVLYDHLKLKRSAPSGNALFTAEQEEKIAEARVQHPWISTSLTNHEASAQAWTNRVGRLEFLSQFLSPEQLLYYQLDREGGAGQVERLLAGISPTKAEFLGVSAILLSNSGLEFNGSLSPELAAALGKVLAPERLALLQELQQPEYRALCLYSVGLRLAPDTIATLVSLRKNTYRSDPASYGARVKEILTRPQLAEIYLSNKMIHPDE